MLRLLGFVLVFFPLSGCYYMQAAAGQWEVLRKRKPVDEIIGDADTSPELARRLRLVEEARDFSIDVLLLPDNGSYRTYADLERDYVVWSVFAAPEFSLTPKQWCFPVAGCVGYRGYFSKDKAVKEADRLRERGYDVGVGGVSAYSTLGRFDDPVLNTMMRWNDVRLVAVLFHELAHQVVYVKGDTTFNESFATAVEEFGVVRWLDLNGREGEYEDYVREREYRQRLMAHVAEARVDLAAVYETRIPDAEKRRQKNDRLKRLADAMYEEAVRAGREKTVWSAEELNNARLASMTFYEGLLPYFRALLAGCNDDIACFYNEVGALASLPAAERQARIDGP